MTRRAVLLILLTACPATAQAEPLIDQAPWDGLLSRHVRDGRVDYAGLKADPQPLEHYLIALRYAETSQLESPEDQLAFWINAYNACVLKHVADHYPVATVKAVPGFFDTLTCQIGRKAMTLNQIHVTGRRIGDWRIHMALANGASGNPPLRAEAYAPDRLDGQLNDQARRFLLDPDRGMRVDPDWRFVWVSHIFKWYTRDFIRKGPLTSDSLLLVLHRHVDPALLERAQRQPLALNFLDYDWALNSQAGHE